MADRIWRHWAWHDRSLVVALTIAAVPLWKFLSLKEECRSRAQHAALAAARCYEKDSYREVEAACTETLAIAEHLNERDYQGGLWPGRGHRDRSRGH
jgi:hypothetical protein